MSIAEITGSNVRERWVEKVGRSIKGSDTPQPAVRWLSETTASSMRG